MSGRKYNRENKAKGSGEVRMTLRNSFDSELKAFSERFAKWHVSPSLLSDHSQTASPDIVEQISFRFVCPTDLVAQPCDDAEAAFSILN